VIFFTKDGAVCFNLGKPAKSIILHQDHELPNEMLN